jgi:DNA-nicking Smr family endonuclease
MSLEMAFDLLVQSIIQSYQKGFKCLLLITGKGKNTLEGHISIKSQLENWLQLPELSEKIIKYVDALPSDGGTGAVYLLLKTKH